MQINTAQTNSFKFVPLLGVQSSFGHSFNSGLGNNYFSAVLPFMQVNDLQSDLLNKNISLSSGSLSSGSLSLGENCVAGEVCVGSCFCECVSLLMARTGKK